jgi:integrase
MIELAMEEGLRCCAAIIVFGLCEGPRCGEIWSLEWPWVRDLFGPVPTVTLHNVKSTREKQRDRVISGLREYSLTMLRTLAAQAGTLEGPVFRADDGRPFLNEKQMGRIINKQLRYLARRVGAPNPEAMTMHPLRHSATSYAHLVRPELLWVKKRMAWKSTASAERYIHLMDDAFRPQVVSFFDTSLF